MFEQDKTLQKRLFGLSFRDLVSAKSDVWLYLDLFDHLDLKVFEKEYSHQGQVPKEPRLMLQVITYGLTHGIASGRKLEELCRNDNRFIVLSGDLRPDRRTIDRFLKRHEKNFVLFFQQIVQLAQKIGLVHLGRVAIDGSRFKGHTSAHRGLKASTIDRAIAEIEQSLQKLRDDLRRENAAEVTYPEDELDGDFLDQKKRLEKLKRAKQMIELEEESRVSQRRKNEPKKSLNDPEALSMSSRKKTFHFGYNLQAAVDETAQIIIAADVHDKATDYGGLEMMVEQVIETTGEKPASVLADCGYTSAENAGYLAGKKIEAYLPLGGEKSEKVATPGWVNVRKLGDDHFECPAGQRLKVAYRYVDRPLIQLRLPKQACANCPLKDSCGLGHLKSKHFDMPEEHRRQAMIALHARAPTQEYQNTLRRRKAIVEPVFGNVRNKGLRILRVGKQNVKSWWKLVCTALNVEKIINSGMPLTH